jgi:hypothetical protein
MRTLNMAVLAALGLAMLTGCEEKYQLTFVNGTQDQRSVELVMPGGGPMMIGTVDGMGDKARTSFKIDSGDLPMTLKWRAGDLDGLIPLDSKTAHELWIHIDRYRTGPVDRKTEINTHEKSESTEKVHQGTVVQ